MNMLRRALESANPVADDENGPMVVMKGPLSDVYAQALNVAYAKDQPQDEEGTETGTAMESTMMTGELTAMQKLAGSMVPEGEEKDAFQTVYGVSRSSISDQIVVDLVKELAHEPDNSEFILIIDATQPSTNGETSGTPEERIVEVTATLEGLVEAHGGKVFTSLEAFAQSR